MSTTLHSFMDIFETEFEAGEEKVQLKKIAIPLIQRDYAQGRLDGDVNRVRTRFLAALHDAIVNKPITLDFVYGDIDEKGVMNKLSLSLLGAGGRGDGYSDASSMEEIFAVAKKDKRLVSAINDDFFYPERMAIYTPEVLAEQREILHTALDRPLEFWSVAYERECKTGADIYAHAKEYDLTTLWIWYSENIDEMNKYLEWGRSLTKDGRVILGVYMYDYGNGCPISDDHMKKQLDFTYEKLISGEIEGAMLHSSCNMDIGLNATQITKQWLDEVIK